MAAALSTVHRVQSVRACGSRGPVTPVRPRGSRHVARAAADLLNEVALWDPTTVGFAAAVFTSPIFLGCWLSERGRASGLSTQLEERTVR
jgi:hypothetical protein